MKPAVCIISPDGILFLNPVKIPAGMYGANCEIPENESYDEI